MAPTTLTGQKTTSSPFGRDSDLTGQPMRIAELLAVLPGTVYSVRRSLHDARHINQAKKAIHIAFKAQLMGLGYSIVELLSSCPINWGMTPEEAQLWVKESMIPVFPLGDYKVADELKNLTPKGRR